MAGRIHEASGTSRDRIDAVLGPPTSTRDPAQATDLRSALTFALRFYYDAFEAFDAILYPLEFGTPIAETNAVEIRRISPLECERPHEARPEARALCGTSISHFGAFFELEWRKHDMLWGRLNASESIIRALRAEEHPQLERADRGGATPDCRRLRPPISTRQPDMPEGSWEWFLETLRHAEEAAGGADDRGARSRGGGGGQRGRRRPVREGRPRLGVPCVGDAPEPRRLRAVAHIFRAVVLGTLPGQVALGAWLALVVRRDLPDRLRTRASPLGIALLVLAALLAGARRERALARDREDPQRARASASARSSSAPQRRLVWPRCST